MLNSFGPPEGPGGDEDPPVRPLNKQGGSALDNSHRPLGGVFDAKACGDCENGEADNAGGGIWGLRPMVLTPPPVMLRPVVDNVSSTWDLLNLFGPQEGPGGDKDSPVCHLNEKDWWDGDDENVSEERTSQIEGDPDSCLSTSVEDKESEDKYDVGNTLSANIFEPVRNVFPNGSFRRRITSWQKDSPVCHLNKKDWSDGDDEKVSEERSSQSKDDWHSCLSASVEDEESDDKNGGIGRRITSWEKGELLGSGSFGSVYERITDDGLFFAVKEVSLLDQGSQGKQSLFQLEQEISLLSQFEHENIVQYLGTDKDDKKLFIFLELMTKGSLATLYHKYNLRDSQVSAYTRQILNGLKYLHDRNVLHRDIKCANILVDASGFVKLADFGLAKATKMNDAKSLKGTAFWMAPEVVNLKNRSYGLAADIWSLGCTVLEMLTRRPPYSHLEVVQALFRIGKGEPPPVPDSLSREARDLILRCLQVNPNDRPSAAQLLDHPFVRKPSTSGLAGPRYRNKLS